MTLCLGGYTLAGKMSVIERIRQIQEQRANQATEAEAARVAAEKEDLIARHSEEVQKTLTKTLARETLNESGVYWMLSQIESFLAHESRTNGIFDMGILAAEQGRVGFELVWDFNLSQLKDSKERPAYDCKSFNVQVDPKSKSITIFSHSDRVTFTEEQWRDGGNQELMEKAIADAFLSPYIHIYNPSWAEPGYGGGLS